MMAIRCDLPIPTIAMGSESLFGLISSRYWVDDDSMNWGIHSTLSLHDRLGTTSCLYLV